MYLNACQKCVVFGIAVLTRFFLGLKAKHAFFCMCDGYSIFCQFSFNKSQQQNMFFSHVFFVFPHVFPCFSMVSQCFAQFFHGFPMFLNMAFPYGSFEGTIDVLIYKAKKKGGGRIAVADERPTPRFTELIDNRCLGWDF